MFKKIMQFIAGKPSDYVSETDRFLAERRIQQPTLSASQQAEVANHEKIVALRDGTAEPEAESKLWREF